MGMTGLCDILYVASTFDNAIFAVPNASTRTGLPAPARTGRAIFNDDHLRGPLAPVFAPNGDLLTSNGDAVNADLTQPSEIVEFTKGTSSSHSLMSMRDKEVRSASALRRSASASAPFVL